MRHGSLAAMLIAVCTADPASGAGTQAVSYSEPHDVGSDLVLTQGIWDCGGMAPDDAAKAMVGMVRHPERRDGVGRAAGCTRTLDPDRSEAPWRVVRRIADLCEDRTRERDETVLPTGRRQTRSYEICGREGHALVVRRDGVLRTAIDVIDLDSYD
jgi:hypothetical protein